MARLHFSGLESYETMLSRLALSEEIKSLCGGVIYEGAKIVADAVRSEMEQIPTFEGMKHGSEANKLNGITRRQKEGLEDGFGIAEMRCADGGYDVKLGFEGYNKVYTRKRPYGQSNAMIARSVNSGTSFRVKNPFMDRAVRKVRKQAEEAMVKKAEIEFEKKAKGK